MAEKTFQNIIDIAEVSMGVMQLAFAPEGTAWSPGRVDISSLPAGFFPLGAVQDDAAQVRVNRTPFDLRTGLPRNLAYRAYVDMAGELAFVFHSNANQKAFMSLGGPPPLHIRLTAHSSAPPAVTSVYPAARNTVAVNSISGFVVGQMVVTGADTSIAGGVFTLDTTYNYAHILSINTASKILHLDHNGFAQMPVIADKLVGIERDDFYLGTTEIRFFRLLGITDFLNGDQVIYDFRKAAPRGELTDQARAIQDYRMPAMFDLFGVPETVLGQPHTILGVRHEYKGTQPGN